MSYSVLCFESDSANHTWKQKIVSLTIFLFIKLIYEMCILFKYYLSQHTVVLQFACVSLPSKQEATGLAVLTGIPCNHCDIWPLLFTITKRIMQHVEHYLVLNCIILFQYRLDMASLGHVRINVVDGPWAEMICRAPSLCTVCSIPILEVCLVVI